MVSGDRAATDTADREIVITRVLNAPRELAFRAFVDREQVGKWWGPRGFTTTTHEMDVRPGGVWRFIMHGPDGTDFGNLIKYLEIVESERLVYDHGGDDGTVEFQSTITFEAQGGKTLLTMRAVFPSVEERDRVVREVGAIEGGNQTVDRLAEHLAAGDLGLASGGVLEIVRIFDAPREVVFAAWTEPERFVQWWGPTGYSTPFCEIDLRPGGAMRYCMRSPQGQDVWCGGGLLEVTPPSRLLLMDYFTDQAGNRVPATHYGMEDTWPTVMLVSVSFDDLDGKTKLTLHHYAGESPQAGIDGANQGWSESFDKLAAYLAR